MVASAKRRKLLWFAAVFAAVATALQPGVWDRVLVALVGVEGMFQVTDWFSPVLVVLGPAIFVLNFGGAILGARIQDLYYPREASGVWWVWLIIPTLAASFVQGFAYGWLGLALRDVWVSSRARATAYAIFVALTVVISYASGVTHFHKVNCRDGDAGDCDLGFLGGLPWASLALGVSVGVVVILETLVRKRSVTGSSHVR